MAMAGQLPWADAVQFCPFGPALSAGAGARPCGGRAGCRHACIQAKQENDGGRSPLAGGAQWCPLAPAWGAGAGRGRRRARAGCLGQRAPCEAAVQRAVPLALGAAAGRAGHHIQLPHRMPDLHVQLLHGADAGSCIAPQAHHSPSSALHKH